MIQRLPMAVALVKTGNSSENLQNEIRQIIYPLYREKEITKNVYQIKMISIKLKIEWINILFYQTLVFATHPRI